MPGRVAQGRYLAIDRKTWLIRLIPSGYTDEVEKLDYIEAGFCNLLPKPYLLGDLQSVLNTS